LAIYTWQEDQDLFDLLPIVLKEAAQELQTKKTSSGSLGAYYDDVHMLKSRNPME
jgi:hypothetical protein